MLPGWDRKSRQVLFGDGGSLHSAVADLHLRWHIMETWAAVLFSLN